MKRLSIITLYLMSALFFNSAHLQAAKINFGSAEDAEIYITSHYNLGCDSYNRQHWRKAASEFEKVIYSCPQSDAAAEAAYYLAVCYFEMQEYDFANREFSNYLKASEHPAFFEDAIYYKFCIAEHFKAGKKKRPFELRYLPKWVSAQDLALSIYDEIVAALPNHELSIQALYSKAGLLCRMREFRECIENYQMIIRRFPKDEVIPDCYLKIAETYYEQSRYEPQNPDLLALAELNVRKFKEEFPRDERVEIAEGLICRMKEIYARTLYHLGLFYERMRQPAAAAIYYQSSIEEFPNTRIAQLCYERLNCLGYCVESTENELPEISASFNSLEMDKNGSECEDFSEQTCITKSPPEFHGEYILPNQEAPYQEYHHYSILKKKDNQPSSFEPIDYQQDSYTESVDGNSPQSYISDPKLEEDSAFMMHYSQLKRRDQTYAKPQN